MGSCSDSEFTAHVQWQDVFMILNHNPIIRTPLELNHSQNTKLYQNRAISYYVDINNKIKYRKITNIKIGLQEKPYHQLESKENIKLKTNMLMIQQF